MKTNLIYFLMLIAITQLVVVTILTELISEVELEFDPFTMFAGNVQMILIIVGYKVLTKYVRLP